MRVWTKKIKYDVRKNFADSRVRIKGRFVKKEEEGGLFFEFVKLLQLIWFGRVFEGASTGKGDDSYGCRSSSDCKIVGK